MKSVQKGFLGLFLLGVLLALIIIFNPWGNLYQKLLEKADNRSIYSQKDTENKKSVGLRKKSDTKRVDNHSENLMLDDENFADKLAESRAYISNLKVGDTEFRTSGIRLYIGDGDATKEIKVISNIVYRGSDTDAEKLLNDSISDNPEVRSEAVVELGFFDNEIFEPLLISLLKTDPVDDVRQKAAASLETHHKSPYAIRALADSIKDTSEDVRTNVLASLRAMRNDNVQKELTGVLAEESLDKKTVDEVRIILDRYYLKNDPFANLADK